jgi:uncharacterized OsmC-like protein
MSEESGFSLDLRRIDDFEFEVRFDREQFATLTVDEPEPIGHDRGPNAARLVGAAVGNCLSASLLFCLKKSQVEVDGLETTVRGGLRRNDRGRLRLGRIDVEIRIDLPEADRKKLDRCLDLFEDFCVVTASIREGVDVDVRVIGGDSEILSGES